MELAEQGPATVVQRLLAAINAHDLEAMVALFAEDYVNEWPAHPQRSFRGNEQVRRNWSQIFAGVPDLQARLPRMVVDGDTVWTEWDMSGTRRDGAPHLTRGVSIFGVRQGRLAWVRFYLEPVEETSGDVDAHTRQVVGASPAEADAAGVQS
jgi:ketosteroid isomerase-like protein